MADIIHLGKKQSVGPEERPFYSVYCSGINGVLDKSGPCSLAFCVINPQGVELERHIEELGDNATVHMAEYLGLKLAVNVASALIKGKPTPKAHFFCSDQLVVRQMNDEWRINAPYLKIEAQAIREMLKASKFNWRILWILGRENLIKSDHWSNYLAIHPEYIKDAPSMISNGQS
jgi:ribonuclease HI